MEDYWAGLFKLLSGYYGLYWNEGVVNVTKFGIAIRPSVASQ